MFSQTVMTCLLLVCPPQQTDTTFSVSPELRLDVSNHAGEIVIRTWDRDEVRLRASHSGSDRILIDHTTAGTRVRAESWQPWADRFNIEGRDVEIMPQFYVHADPPELNSIVNYEITVPESLPLVLGGPYTQVVVENARGEVDVKVSEGDVTVSGGRGSVSVSVAGGDVLVDEGIGRIRVESLSGRITIQNSSGDVSAETSEGEIKLTNIESPRVEASSVVGDISYEGEIQAHGWYAFRTHEGDVTVTIPSEVSARITVATFAGRFQTDFPVTLPEDLSRKRLEFTLSSGSALVELEAFDGSIELRRTGRGGG
jgi:hypothetical protein